MLLEERLYIYAQFYKLGLTRELTTPRVGVTPSLSLV